MDLTDFWLGRMSLRRLSVLTDALLDYGGHVWAVLAKEDPGWTRTDLLLADLFYATTGKVHPSREKALKARSSSGRHVTDIAARLKAQRNRKG